MTTFRVNAAWIEYAHGPGAESAQPLAAELVELPGKAGVVLIPAHRFDLVEEIISVADLYTSDSSVQENDRLWFRAYPINVVRRGQRWLTRFHRDRHRYMFTVENTKGNFTHCQCELLNWSFGLLRDQGLSAAVAHEIVSNNWTGEGDTVGSLTGEDVPY